MSEAIMSVTVEQAWMTFRTPLLQFVRRRVEDEASAEDILQDVFLKVHTHIDTLSDASKLRGWLFQLARNAVIDYYRQTRVTVDIPEELPALSEEEENDAVAQLAPAVKVMVAALPDRYREALLLTEYEGMTQRELAEKLGISLSGAKSRVQRARQMLRQMLLDCCHFELDQRHAIISYKPHRACCATNDHASKCHCS